jgi:hypothetical protein
MLRLQTIALFAVLGTIAFGAERLLYEALIVPRLSTVPKVPLWWWIGEVLPPVLVFLYTGWCGRSLMTTLALSLAAFLPWLAARALSSLITGRPVGHDLWVTDPQFWIGAILQFGLWLIVASVGLGTRRLTAG